MYIYIYIYIHIVQLARPRQDAPGPPHGPREVIAEGQGSIAATLAARDVPAIPPTLKCTWRDPDWFSERMEFALSSPGLSAFPAHLLGKVNFSGDLVAFYL